MSQATENNTDSPSPAGSQDDFATLFAASEAHTKQQKKVAIGDLLSGTVIAIGQSSAFVAIGGKGEAIIDPNEFRDPATGELKLAVGDTVQATVVDDGSRSGSVMLRRVMGRGGAIAAELETAMASKLPVEGVVSAEVKGGFEVQLGTTRAFCPGSQIDRRRGGERAPASDYIGKRFPFRVTKVEQGGRNVVVSRRELLDEEAAEQAAKTWEQIRPGAVLTGRVTSVRDFGAFVDLGGVEGMIHISELGYGRVKHPSDVVAADQTVEVQVLKVSEEPDNRGRRQIALSLKALASDPWSTVAQHFPVGSTTNGVVRRLEAFGAFVEIAPGIEGLVHISKITLDRRLAHARQALEVGQSVAATVLGVDPAQRRLSLSLVEQARNARDAETAAERRDEESVIAQTNERKSFGNFADLLAASRKR